MKKKYIKLNIDDNHLSLGNFCRILKQLSVNKTAALQTEIFISLFDIDNIQDTTVNNYCVGCRSIKDEYIQKYLTLQKKYVNDSQIMAPIIIKILSILEGKLYLDLTNEEIINQVNNSKLMKEFCLKLYNISKNDKSVTPEFSQTLSNYLNKGNLYDSIATILFFIILEKKQPIYEENIKKEIIENILNQTNISSNDLEEYLNLKFCEGSNYYYSLKNLADNKNAYACFELGNLEYEGHIKGYPRYEISYSYFLEATKSNHPSAYYYIGRMFFNKNIGSGNQEELSYAYEMFKKSASLGSISALNSIGIYYLNGIYPVNKDKNKAIEYFTKASNHNYVYSLNNLGKIYEDEKKYKEAFTYYKKSADLNESWACNKVGEFYRLGIGTDKNLNQAFSYYNKGIEGPNLYLCYYNLYNLAKYFYFSGCMDIVPTPNKPKAIEYLKEASNHDILPSSIFLFYIYVDNYLKTKDDLNLKYIYEYKKKIETHKNYNQTIKKDIDLKLKEISNHKDIDISNII